MDLGFWVGSGGGVLNIDKQKKKYPSAECFLQRGTFSLVLVICHFRIHIYTVQLKFCVSICVLCHICVIFVLFETYLCYICVSIRMNTVELNLVSSFVCYICVIFVLYLCHICVIFVYIYVVFVSPPSHLSQDWSYLQHSPKLFPNISS